MLIRTLPRLAGLLLPVLLIGCSSSSQGELQSDLSSEASFGTADLGESLEVRPGITYTIDSIEVGDASMCDNPNRAPVGPYNGTYLFVTLTVATDELEQADLPYLDLSAFSMADSQGVERSILDNPENRLVGDCLDPRQVQFNYMLESNSEQTGRFVIDTIAPAGQLILNSRSDRWTFEY